MLYKYEYKTNEERDNIISQNIDKILIEEQNITEGNFLIFTDIEVVKTDIELLQNRVNNLEMLILEMSGVI